ncbi:MAG: Gfo/Idh/MocA family oxidoreductase [Lentisphaerae bacterium]|jgi:predicted dehydrogenase|nr:Gfo/Idh/MocA family oxidoreductase [Lentisphaerota bacterium]MBT4820449.1 Gfo/Idh/MocA family oxidoreductase [Lentisphaerota bacterium]MBT5609252.1 Gfo/Idh/MocA family oxidoreductase [Lentisphaerota bacterium]MBT7055273.1 Gfo/Idh/MocA family oxidoreductase [Lentisphaerota bacterium]MBT7847456.1 Gfo/Idh/MocA family oxidoreductase [Lentisphaerota bacterium]
MGTGKSPNEKLNLAIIGTGGRGRANMQSTAGENIVALCDVNEDELAQAAAQFPNAKTYVDWRECIDQPDLDGVVCSTIDHTHAMVNVWALNRDLHVFGEKPLANSVYDARVVRQKYLEKKDRLVTQMCVQRHTIPNMARVSELIHDGAIGTPREVHLWCGRLPETSDYLPDQGAPPSNIHWDLWLGPTPYHPYNETYVKPRERGSRCLTWNIYWDFGSGQLGDMGSHIMDIAWWALDLGSPVSVTCEGADYHSASVPSWVVAEWEHPANDWRPEIKVCWYDGGKMPELPGAINGAGMNFGAYFKGDEGSLVCDFNNRYLIPKGDLTYYAPRTPDSVIPDSPGHAEEWIEACKTGVPTRTDFDYSGTLVEQNLLALVAYRVGRKLTYDPATGTCPGCPEADQYIRPAYRDGWVLDA